MNWRSLLQVGAIIVFTVMVATGDAPRWFPPTPRSGLVDEIGALSETDAVQLRALLKEAVQRDDVRLAVLILKESPPVPPPEIIKTMIARQKRCWFRGLICVRADTPGPPIVGFEGSPEFPSNEFERALATVRDGPLHESELGPRILRATADLLDELHLLRLAHPPAPTTWAGEAMAWGTRHPTLSVGIFFGAMAVVTIAVKIWRRPPRGLRFPVMPMPARLGGPYTGGSRVCANFDAATIARSRERARR